MKHKKQAIDRIVSKHQQKLAFQVGFITMNTNGEIGTYSIHKGLSYTYYLRGIVQINQRSITTNKSLRFCYFFSVMNEEAGKPSLLKSVASK